MSTDTNEVPRHSFMMRFTIWFSSSRVGQKIYVHLIPPIDRWLMRLSKGKYSISPQGDSEGIGGLALASTVGAKSGKMRHTPLGFANDGDTIVVLASNAARSYHPAWYFNLRKNPNVTITVPGRAPRKYIAAEVPPGPERDRLWNVLLVMNPGFAQYVERAQGRVMPVIHCKPMEAPAG